MVRKGPRGGAPHTHQSGQPTAKVLRSGEVHLGSGSATPDSRLLPLPPAARRGPLRIPGTSLLRIPGTSLVDRNQESGQASTLTSEKNKAPSLLGLLARAGAHSAFRQEPLKVREP